MTTPLLLSMPVRTGVCDRETPWKVKGQGETTQDRWLNSEVSQGGSAGCGKLIPTILHCWSEDEAPLISVPFPPHWLLQTRNTRWTFMPPQLLSLSDIAPFSLLSLLPFVCTLQSLYLSLLLSLSVSSLLLVLSCCVCNGVVCSVPWSWWVSGRQRRQRGNGWFLFTAEGTGGSSCTFCKMALGGTCFAKGFLFFPH